MKLYYYKDPRGNFGDDINPWLWNKLAPEILGEDPSELLVGIGTLINNKIPEGPIKLIFGSGVGYGSLPVIDEKWKFYFVRGPLSAMLLGLDKSTAISDPAILIPQLVNSEPIHSDQRISFIPHHGSINNADWRKICEKARINYIDPASDFHDVILNIRQSKLVIAEAMHAAIFADAFRVPWVSVKCYDHILDFKWHDWCQSLNMNYMPERLPSLWDVEKNLGIKPILKNKLKRGLSKIGIRSADWTPPLPKTSGKAQEDAAVTALINIANDTSLSTLSEDRHLKESTERILEKLEELKKDCAK